MRFQNTRQPDRDWWDKLWPDPHATLRALGVDDARSALDLGCGDGLFTVALAELVDGPVYGVDIDTNHLETTRSHAVAADVDVALVAGDARTLSSLLSDSVEYVLFGNTFHGVGDTEALTSEVHAILADDGRFGVINWHDRPREETTVAGERRGPPNDLRLTPAETRSLVEPAGFDHVETVELPPYHYGIVFQRRD